MLERQQAIELLMKKYQGSRVVKAHALIFTFPNGKQAATDKASSETQRTAFSLIVNTLPPSHVLPSAKFEHYPMGDAKHRHNHNVTKEDAPTLYWQENDTWRVYLETQDRLETFLGWYLGSDGVAEVQLPEVINNTQQVAAQSPERPTITLEEQEQFDEQTKSFKTDEKEALVKVRYGQGYFRDALIQIDGPKCWMTGIEGEPLLIASHIKPWSHCDEDYNARGNPDNGLLLSALWDAAFDAGLVTFGEDWQVITSDDLPASAGTALGRLFETVLPEQFRTSGRKVYLTYHREIIFEKWKKK